MDAYDTYVFVKEKNINTPYSRSQTEMIYLSNYRLKQTNFKH